MDEIKHDDILKILDDPNFSKFQIAKRPKTGVHRATKDIVDDIIKFDPNLNIINEEFIIPNKFVTKNQKKEMDKKKKEDKDDKEKGKAKITDFLEEDKEGKGKIGGKIGGTDGLWSDEIDKIMDKYKSKGYKGTYSIDEIGKIPINNEDKIISFIMNTLPSYIHQSGHWVSIFITPENLEYNDSFGEDPPKEFLTNIKPLIDKFSPNRLLQFKINRIKKQNGKSNNCGYFAMKSIIDRYGGKNFKEITDFNKINQSSKGEGEIKEFKKKLKPFEYI